MVDMFHPPWECLHFERVGSVTFHDTFQQPAWCVVRGAEVRGIKLRKMDRHLMDRNLLGGPLIYIIIYI